VSAKRFDGLRKAWSAWLWQALWRIRKNKYNREFHKGGKDMFGVTRKRLAVVSSAITITLVLILVLATTASARGPIVHRVHVGGPDACAGWGLPPGCDRNFSLVAMEHADGSVSGQWDDQWPGYGGFHAVIDCLHVVGNEAWVSGVITHGYAEWYGDLAGLPVSARVVDNGTTANDPPDQISFTEGDGAPCDAQLEYDLFDFPQGQVVVE
jgi:hypothetical protein